MCSFTKVTLLHGPKPAIFLKATLRHGCSRFKNCTNGIKSRKASHMEIKTFVKIRHKIDHRLVKVNAKKLDPNSNRLLLRFPPISLAGMDGKIRPRLSQMFYRMAVLKISPEFTRDHPRQRRFSNTLITESTKSTIYWILRNFKEKLFRRTSPSVYRIMHIWDKVFKNEPSEVSERQPLKNLKWSSSLSLQIFERLSSTNFTWSILEYFAPYIFFIDLFC